jgi:imidazolonepropionase-like amidohydrolase
MGGQLSVLAAYRDAKKKYDPAWPRVVAAGVILDGPVPVQPDVSIAVADSSGAVDAVQMLSRAGVDFIKVYTMLPRDAYFAAVGEARRLSLPVAGHVPGAVTPEEAANAGQRSIEHLRDEIEPFCRRGDAAECVRLAAIFRARGTWQVPTLVALRAKAQFDDPSLDDDPRLNFVPKELRDEWSAGRRAKIQRGSEYLMSRRSQYADEVWLTGFLAQQHVPLLAGTDAGSPYCYPGFSLHDELELLVVAGLTPLDALRAATLSPADFFGARNMMGTIEVGRVADMVVLNGNPLLDIGTTRDIEAVVLRGRILEREELDEMLRAAGASTTD